MLFSAADFQAFLSYFTLNMSINKNTQVDRRVAYFLFIIFFNNRQEAGD